MLFSINLLGFVAVATAASATELPKLLFKDVVVIGGGASGTYAAIRLRDDENKSVAVIEKQSILVRKPQYQNLYRVSRRPINQNIQGGHVDSWTDPETGIAYDYGVKSFIDSGPALDFFDRLGVETGEMPREDVTTEYIDFKTGASVNFTPPEFPTQLAALEKFLVQAEKYEPLIQGPGYFGIPQGNEIPEDLFLPFGEFAEKYEFEDAMPFIYQTTGLGVGNITQEMTIFALQSFGASMARSTLGLQASFVPASLRNQDLYDSAAKVLGEDVLYDSTVQASIRTEWGVVLTVKNNKTGKLTIITARRLLIAVDPTEANTGTLSLDRNEKNLLSKFRYNREYTGIINNANLDKNISYFNLPSSAAPNNLLALPEAPFNARIDYMGSGHYFRVTVVGDNDMTADEAKALVQHDLDKLVEGGQIADNGDNEVSWVDFSIHGPMHARVSANELKDDFFKKLYKLQGQRSTWWTGGSFSVNFQTHLWEFDDIIIPDIIEGL